MIDFVVVSSELRLYVLDTQAKRGAELSPAGGEFDPLAGEEARPKQVGRVCWECLAEDPVKMVFNSHL